MSVWPPKEFILVMVMTGNLYLWLCTVVKHGKLYMCCGQVEKDFLANWWLCELSTTSE